MTILLYLILECKEFAQDLDVLGGLSAGRKGCCLWLQSSIDWFGRQESLLSQLGGGVLLLVGYLLPKAELL